MLFLAILAFIVPKVNCDFSSVHFQGRVLFSNSTAAMDWPCTGLSFRVVATDTGNVSLLMDGGGCRFLVSITRKANTVQSIFTSEKGVAQQYLLAVVGAADGIVDISVRKITEASYFISDLTMHQRPAVIQSVILDSSLSFVPPLPPPSRRLEFFGDSDTAGFGIDGGKLLDCLSHMVRNENCDKCYSAQLGGWENDPFFPKNNRFFSSIINKVVC